MKYTYWTVYDYASDSKRRVYTFDNASAAHDMVEFILREDFMPTQIAVEEEFHEAPTKL